MDWLSLLTFAGTAGVISALLTEGIAWLREWWSASSKKHDHAGYLALRLAVLLETYAYKCSDFITENANAYRHPDEEYPHWSIGLPQLPPYPEDDDGWKAIDRGLASKVLNLPNKIHGSQATIDATLEYVLDDLGDTLDEQAATCGLEAWNLATALRQEYKIEAVEAPWDFAGHLWATSRKAQQAIKNRSERNAELMRKLTSKPDQPAQ